MAHWNLDWSQAAIEIFRRSSKQNILPLSNSLVATAERPFLPPNYAMIEKKLFWSDR